VDPCSFIWDRFLGKYIANIDGVVAGLEVYLGPLVKYRLEQESLHGVDWPDKPVCSASDHD